MKLKKKFENEKTYVRKIFNYQFFIIRFFCRSYLIRKKLKILHYNCQYVKKWFSRFYISFFYFLFDSFFVYRNMYNAIKTFYFIFVIWFTKNDEKSSMFSFSHTNYIMLQWKTSWKIFLKLFENWIKILFWISMKNQKKFAFLL